MRAPLSWLREYVDLEPGARGRQVAASLVSVGLEEEDLLGGDITGPLVVGRVLGFTDEPQKNGRTIRWCRVDVGEHGQRVTDGSAQEIVCGATNFGVDDLVVVVLPGAVLPGGTAVSARRTYGHVSNGMICAEDELGLGSDHSGIIVLGDYLGAEAVASLQPGDDAIALLGLDDEVVEVNVTPDRGYCFSLRGIAREYWHATGSRPGGYRDPARLETPAPNEHGYAVRLADDAPLDGAPGCDRYVARVVRGVDPARASPEWMRRRLTQLGMRPISLPVDVTNIVMLALGQPLHAFDVAALSGAIVVRRARAGEQLTTLDGVERPLHTEDLLITDGGDVPLAIAGVMGGGACEVTSTTTDVLIESAHFDPVSVARSSRRHKLVTEASKRFERGVDPAVTAAAAELAVALLVEHGGGRVDAGVTDLDRTAPRRAVRIDVTGPSRLVGVDYPPARVVEILRQIGCEVDLVPAGGTVDGGASNGGAGDGGALTVTPPSWRPDLVDGPDFAEEVARIDGYEKIPSILPTPTRGRGLTHGQKVRRVVANAVAGRGYVEVLTYPFVSESLPDSLGLSPEDDRRNAVRVANPLSDEAPLMRTSILDTLVDAARRNLSRGQRDVALFELGLVTRPGRHDTHTAPVPGVAGRPDDDTVAAIRAAVPSQPRRLALVQCGEAEHAGWWGAGRPAIWSDVLETVQAVTSALAVEVRVGADRDHPPWHPGRCARLTLADGSLVGHAGELHPKVVAALGLPPRTCAAEIDVDVLTRASDRTVQFLPFSTYPVAHTDVALTVPDEVTAAELESALRRGAGPDLESLALFDVYRGDQLPQGSKSLAYRLTFRARDRTLTTDEVSGFRDRAVSAAAAAVGAVQR